MEGVKVMGKEGGREGNGNRWMDRGWGREGREGVEGR